MNKKNYGITPYYDFLSNQRQVCIIAILSISCILFITSGINKTAVHQKNYNLNAKQTNNASLQYIPVVCGSTTLVPVCATSTVLNAASGQSNYLWSTGETTQSITVTTHGDYSWETINMADNKVLNGDFALDGIVFAPVCRKYFDVTFSPYPPKLSITPL